MAELIKILDTNTANQIAAGEVVEKPASVVKELVENALDAGSSSITVTIYAGGTEYICVTDNGSGMSREDALLSVKRHATSKISLASDLEHLNTLGFRGEALPSIASVAKFTILTRQEGAEFATELKVEGGALLSCEEAGGAVGTSVTVRDLFYNVPARRKFLHAVSTEARYINDIVSKIALSRPDVKFRLVHNEKEVVATPGDGDLLNTVAAIYGAKVKAELLPVQLKEAGITIAGYISKPTLLKGTRQWQTFYVNGRTISSAMLSRAVDQAYQSQIPKSGFPFALLSLSLSAAEVDVNVHPQKSEVKFSDEGQIYRLFYRAVSAALTRPLTGQLVVENTAANSNNSFCEEELVPLISSTATSEVKTTYAKNQPAAKEQDFLSADGGNVATKSFVQEEAAPYTYQIKQEDIWKAPSKEERTKTPSLSEAREKMQPQERLTQLFPKEQQEPTKIWPLGQVSKTFIVAQSQEALYLIDQHAAHERIMYDKLVRQYDEIPSQRLLIPLYVNVLPQEIELFAAKREEFLRLGVGVEAGGSDLLRIDELPMDVLPGEAEDFIRDICALFKRGRAIANAELRQEVLHYAACHSAVRAGEELNLSQMRDLINQLLATEHPFTCPHGRPCMIELTTAELFKMFKRT